MLPKERSVRVCCSPNSACTVEVLLPLKTSNSGELQTSPLRTMSTKDARCIYRFKPGEKRYDSIHVVML
ncbi:hypothetical protein MUK42_30933 [Musa troglodytarum]|uniref:Uncharacterized protein n=1 Tax=Musa troglodytarum TaxID=320322 RepID=A0A9E7JV35_9LILI|nr:hypothetical protein MUK42_30933 [Musa troglodytarum]